MLVCSFSPLIISTSFTAASALCSQQVSSPGKNSTQRATSLHSALVASSSSTASQERQDKKSSPPLAPAAHGMQAVPDAGGSADLVYDNAVIAGGGNIAPLPAAARGRSLEGQLPPTSRSSPVYRNTGRASLLGGPHVEDAAEASTVRRIQNTLKCFHERTIVCDSFLVRAALVANVGCLETKFSCLRRLDLILGLLSTRVDNDGNLK